MNSMPQIWYVIWHVNLTDKDVDWFKHSHVHCGRNALCIMNETWCTMAAKAENWYIVIKLFPSMSGILRSCRLRLCASCDPYSNACIVPIFIAHTLYLHSRVRVKPTSVLHTWCHLSKNFMKVRLCSLVHSIFYFKGKAPTAVKKRWK